MFSYSVFLGGAAAGKVFYMLRAIDSAMGVSCQDVPTTVCPPVAATTTANPLFLLILRVLSKEALLFTQNGVDIAQKMRFGIVCFS